MNRRDERTAEALPDGASAGRVPLVEHLLRQQGMPERVITAVLEATEPETVRRYLELHRERSQERFDDGLRALDLVETTLLRIVIGLDVRR